MTKDNVPAVVDALGKALEKAASNVLPAHYEQPREKAQIVYMQIRQKDLKDDKGRILRGAGAFQIGKKDDVTYEDREELLVTILGYRPGRVYFAKLGDAKPMCRTDDMVRGTRARESMNGHPVFGECATCWLAQWGSAENGRQACRENRRLFIVDWSNERPLVLTIGPSSLKVFAAYDNFVADQARKYVGADKSGRVPSIHHLLAVTLRLEYRAEPAGHYVASFMRKDDTGSMTSPVALSMPQQKMMAELWDSSMERFQEAVRNQQYQAEDFKGSDEASGGAGAVSDKDGLSF
jgi:hypothetical protein